MARNSQTKPSPNGLGFWFGGGQVVDLNRQSKIWKFLRFYLSRAFLFCILKL